MLRSMIQTGNESFAHNPAMRGYAPIYRERETNHCPGCGRSHWLVGRVSAECGFCSTALPLAEAATRGGGMSRSHKPIFFTSDGVRA